MSSQSPNPTDERRDWHRVIAGLAITLLVLVPVLAGRILGPGWPHPATLGADDTADPADPAPSSEGDPRSSPVPLRALMPAVDPNAPWLFATAGEVWSQPVAQKGLVLVGSDDGTGYAVDATSGREVWRLDTRGAVRSRAAISGDLVVWTSADGFVYAADADSGENRWRIRVAATSGAAQETGQDGRILVGTADGLVALDAGSGRVAWRTNLGAVEAAPAVAAGRVYAGTTSGQVVAVDVRNGKRLWTFDAGAEISTSPVPAERFVLVTAGDGTVYCLDAAGRERWRYGTSEFVGSAPTVTDGRVFVGGGDGALWAFDLRSGLGLWRRRLAEPVRGTPVADGETLWMAAGERYLAAVRATDGEPLHVFAVEGWVSASPLVVSPDDGPKRLVFATSDGSLHGVPLRLVTEELALRPPPARPEAPEEARLVIEPTFHDGTPEILWQVDLPGRPAAAPALAAGRLVVGAGRHLVALDAVSGNELWNAQGKGSFDATPAIVGSRVLAPGRADGNGQGSVTAFDLYDGRELWKRQAKDDVTSTPTVWRGLALFGSAAGEIVAVAIDDGAAVWTHTVAGAVNAAAAVAGSQGFGIAIAGSCDGTVYGLSAEDGRELWQFEAEDCVGTDAVVARASGQEAAFVADAGGHIYALDPAVGGELWRASLGGSAGRRPLVQDGTLYLGSHDGNLWALSAIHGGGRWRFDAGGPISGSIVLDLGIAYGASADGALHAVSAINGQEFWRLETPAPAYDVAFADGIVYVVTGGTGTAAGRIYALRVP